MTCLLVLFVQKCWQYFISPFLLEGKLFECFFKWQILTVFSTLCKVLLNLNLACNEFFFVVEHNVYFLYYAKADTYFVFKKNAWFVSFVRFYRIDCKDVYFLLFLFVCKNYYCMFVVKMCDFWQVLLKHPVYVFTIWKPYFSVIQKVRFI